MAQIPNWGFITPTFFVVTAMLSALWGSIVGPVVLLGLYLAGTYLVPYMRQVGIIYRELKGV